MTIHSLFDLDGDTYSTKLDFAKKNHKVQMLVGLDRRGTARALLPMYNPRCSPLRVACFYY